MTAFFSHCNNKFKKTLDVHAPIKIPKLRENTKPHINKTLKKEIMKSLQDLKIYKIQRNIVTKLNKNLKKA